MRTSGALRAAGDRGAALQAMARGAAALTEDCWAAASSTACSGWAAAAGPRSSPRSRGCCPVGVPKLLVSTMASGDVSAYVGESDMTLMYSVVDIAGLNVISREVLRNAAAAVGAHGPGVRRRPAPRSPTPATGRWSPRPCSA